MIIESQIKSAIKCVAGKEKGASIELKDDGPRGGGRLTCAVRKMASRVSTEWYAVYYRDGRRMMTKLGTYPEMPIVDARRKFAAEYAPVISSGDNPALLSQREANRQARKGGTCK